MRSLVLIAVLLSMPIPAHASEAEATRVMNAGLPVVEQMLTEHREFAPFGAVMLSSKLIQVVGADEPTGDAAAEKLFEELGQALRKGATNGDYRAVATFAMVELRMPESGEIVTAVHVALEHRDGYCVDVYYPTIPEGPGLVLGEAVAGKRNGTYFECPPLTSPAG